ncbi:IPT/TIG domain-containing protein [Patescibacteria group bacterium]|nr:IPT/TIG domain-containing protein [Patescibacteria group bacterium]
MDDLILIRTSASDDSGVSHVETSVDGSLVGTGSSAASSSATLVAEVEWDTSGLTSGPRSLSSRIYDLDSNTADTPPVSVVVRPRHCFNGATDADETDIDCGGADCGACSGGACTSGSMCASGVCSGGVCVEQPVITLVSPDDGRPGTLVSITGVNFGSTPGAVIFSPRIAASAPAACVASGSPTWTPTQIIVSVPEGAVDGPIEIENAAGLIDTTNDARGPVLDNFDVNDATHPGLCAVRPGSGQAGERIELVGVGLGTSSDRVTFTDRAVSSFLSWADDVIALNAPVFEPATYLVKVFVGASESNAVSFRLNERTTTAAPVIDALSPTAGPIGEYVTLQGRNFGGRTGRVFFRRGDGQGIADTDFPEQCSVAFWTNTAVTVKVPRTFRQGLGDTPLTSGEWQVVLERQDTVESNGLAFTVNTNEPRPGICAIQPAAGPVDTRVEIFGERFGSISSGEANFAGPSGRVPMSVAASDWSAGRIVGLVPRGSITGPVQVRQGSNDSNGVPFAVRNCNEDASICAVGEVCCRTGACSVGGSCPSATPNAEFAWQLSTGLLPINPRVVEECSPSRPASPSPWSGRTGGDRACVNSEVFIRFTTPLNPASVSISGADASLVIRKCTGPAESPCSTASDPVPPAPGGWSVGVEGSPDTGNGYIQFTPAAMWDGNSTYQIILTTGIRSNTNVPMLADYRFTFSTRGSTELCRVGTINVVPGSATLSDIGATQSELAVPRAADDICINLRADAYDWRWSTSDGRAEITNESETRPDSTRRGLERQTATARAETGADPVRVSASMTQEGETVEGLGDLFIRLQPPRVVAYGPNCDQACLNAAAWARFNTGLDPASVTTDNVILRRCVNENCLSYDLDVDLSSADIRLTRAPDSVSDAETYVLLEPTGAGGSTLLEVGRFYRITLRGGDLTGIRSTNGLPLAGLNDPEGFSWTFRVKEGDDARCAVARVNVTPGEKYELEVGARQSFAATPISAPDACNSEGSPLISDRTYAWSVEQPAPISRLVNAGTGLAVAPGIIDTTSDLPAGCSGRCLNMGSDGIDGRVASCGNGVIETTDARYCVGSRTPFGTACRLLPPGSRGAEECDEASSACSTTCKWTPMAGGTCGNGVVNVGEQCDQGPDGGRGCSAECQLLGARAGGSTCGNNDVAAGEACDDGNTNNGDGCSADCLHEGSIRVRALCGNGRLESGESCERPAAGAAFPAGCNTTTCLNEGTVSPMCGNAIRDAGEDCDDGNNVAGDGCSTRCLLEGSSAGYAAASFCGDGVRGRGEMCESTGGDLRPDAVQLAEIVGDGEPGADGRMSSQIITDYDSQRGQGTYGLQCGFREESSCSGGNGLDARGCCAPRPNLIAQYPAAGETNVCRNAQLSATFDVRMEEASIGANFVLAEEVTGDACPAGLERVASIEDYDPTPGFRGWMNRTWYRLMSWFRPNAADAAWCAGSARGRLAFQPAGSGTRADFVLENALKADTNYQILFRGDTNLADNADPNNRAGIRSARGVVANGNILWNFRSGSRLCTVTAVHVRDTNVDSPNLFTRAAESHLYTAEVISLQEGRRIALSPVVEYAWVWEPWIASNRDALEAEAGTGLGSDSRSNVTVVNPPQNGSSFIEAGIRITRDDVSVPSSTGRIVKGSQSAQVLLCENPWPARSLAPFTETSGHPSLELLGASPLAGTIRASGPYYNFASLYCRDAGAEGTAGDLPTLNVQPVEVATGDRALGILRQYLFTFDDPALRGDGIGIRVATNPLHLSPRAWYASRGFSGTPEATTVDGYEAVKDGTTWYVGGVNTNAATGAPVYSQIYVISHNPDAKNETKNIVEQLVRNFTLNANIQDGASNACSYATTGAGHSAGELYRGTDGRVVRCTADWECLAQNPTLRCSSFKAKMQRDSKRIVDFQFMTDSLESTRERNGNYPQLQSGTFVPTLSTSRWPSWSAQLQGEVGEAFPNDPVNRFLSCGFCSESGSPCQDSSECPSGQSCNAAATRTGVEPATCWNPTVRQYQCPRLTETVPESASRIYQYRSVNAGARYELSTELEGALASRYSPPLLNEIRRCSNLDAPCLADADCTVTNAGGAVISSGTCNGTGGMWRYHGVCEASSVYGVGGNICGDGVIGDSEICELGDTTPVACNVPGTPAGPPNGTKLQVCDDCRGWIDGGATRCVLNVQCGNGRVDAGETCDDGALNGTYGRCNRTCTGYDAFCGDGRMSPGETCDLGALNGAHCRSGCDAAASCSLSCTGPGPRCGDDVVNGPEQCDGNAERTTSAVCVGGSNANAVCTVAADCPGGACGPTPATASCAGVTARRCSDDRTRSCTVDGDCAAGGRCIAYPTSRTRACNAYGSAAPASDWCTWNSWSDCQPTSYCGDGITDTGEECDDGNRSNNDSCTNACRPNVCGDAFYNPASEECDLGADNGRRTCTADYGSTCLSCSSACRQVASSGGYCGNGVREGGEQCDGTQGLGSCSGDASRSCRADADCASGQTCNLISCRSLGLDYARQVSCWHYSYARRRDDGTIVCITKPCAPGTPSTPGVLCSSDRNNRCYACVGDTDCGIDWVVGDYEGAGSVIDGTIADTVCMPDPATCAPGSICLVTGQPKRKDILECGSSCTLGGCLSCSTAEGTGVITGQVFDAVYFNQPVPNARVTLYNRGLPVGAPTFTDGNGRFSFSRLNSVRACINYRIIVDFYLDNPCTGARGAGAPTCNGAAPTVVPNVDESEYGGYWPYESATFGVSNFYLTGLRNSEGKIYLAPRVGPDETLVIHTWLGNLGGSYIDAHPVYPPVYETAWTGGGLRSDIESDDEYRDCAVSEDCDRDINYGRQGNADMSRSPHANLYCLSSSAGGAIDGCNSFNVAPQTVKWKRGEWANNGKYSFYLVNYGNQTMGSPNRSAYFFYYTSSTVRIITEDRVYTIDAPNIAPTCTDVMPPGSAYAANPNKNGKFWLVFQQEASSGAISFPMSSEQYRCRNQDSLTGHSTVLPNPMWETGSD